MATTDADIYNRALQVLGTRTTVDAAEITAQSSNEVIQLGLIFEAYRKQLLRLAPWNCGIKTENLWYLTSVPGTPENSSPATALWQPGQPAPGWGYEYLYPPDCLKMCWMIPGLQTGFASGVPITTAVTGSAPQVWYGGPVRYKVQTDTFRQATAHTLISGGTGYQVGEIVTLGGAPDAGEVPAGLIQITVATINGSGTILTYTLTSTGAVGKTGFFFAVPTYNLTQITTTGVGTGAEVDVTAVALATFTERVILTNQEYATAAYVRNVTDANVFDEDFIEAFATMLAAGVCMSLTGDKDLMVRCVKMTQDKIAIARQQDGNEGLTVNDVTPDFIRIRGNDWSQYNQGPWANFDWGPSWGGP